ncbi:hypothetical protein PPERSA_04894 [Pseudocohnilembus persalinus]|uniref:Transmembrane protein n=1 Tax=Pseudocohnilembus persalinus TaxID=266149 RepID=A0A0V0QJU8_PSEPJ|nr:hypothetical protein PPERSA_04894 [Pseudocohnilembus persalinus]|eukprot:KRX02272.1 hypothetical protein PPERSA_04894 [Pseudocohnilembus persalinus]
MPNKTLLTCRINPDIVSIIPLSVEKQACYYKQNWIELKLPAWNCKDKQQFQDDVKGLEQKLVYDKCYYDPYFSKKGAEKTAQSNDSVIDMKDFYMVVFEEKPYYNKIEFIIFFGFFWVPFISYTHFAWIPYVAHYINNLIIKKLEQRITKIVQKKEKELRQKQPFQMQIIEKEQKILQFNDLKLVDQNCNHRCRAPLLKNFFALRIFLGGIQNTNFQCPPQKFQGRKIFK